MTVSNLANPELKRHTLTTHIRKNHIHINDSELMERFTEKDKDAKLYSKFKNSEVAEEIIAQALIQNKNKIQKWDNSKINNSLIIKFKSNFIIGYGLNKNGNRFDLSYLTLILAKNKSQGFRIQSAYPS